MTLLEANVRQVESIAAWTRDQWIHLGLPSRTAAEVLALVRREDDGWSRFLDEHASALEKRVAKPLP